MKGYLALAILLAWWPLTAVAQDSGSSVADHRLGLLSAEMRLEIGALQFQLSKDELDELLSLGDDYECRRWIDRHWEHRDPIYTTPENEARDEHMQRVNYVRDHFFIPKWPMFDQRGEVYMRYGQPSFRRVFEPEATAGGPLPEREFWAYQQFDMYILFEDAFGNGNFTYYLERQRTIHEVRLDRISSAIDAPMVADLAPPDISVESQYNQFFKKLAKFDDVKEQMPSMYLHDFPATKFPFYYQVQGFREEESMSRVDVNIEFMANFHPTSDKPANEYVTTAVFWDINGKEVGRESIQLNLPVVGSVEDSTRLTPLQLTFKMPPGFYNMAVTLQEKNTWRVSSYRDDVTCEDFHTKLAMSDVTYAMLIRDRTRESMFNRGDLEVIPHPVRQYRLNAALPIYFEVYNLGLSPSGASSYTVEYRIVSLTERKVGFWKSLFGKKSTLDVASSFQGSSRGPHDTVHISVGSDNLWPGDFKLEVKIVDEVSGDEVRRETQFAMVE